jgi:hypothetical protein
MQPSPASPQWHGSNEAGSPVRLPHAINIKPLWQARGTQRSGPRGGQRAAGVRRLTPPWQWAQAVVERPLWRAEERLGGLVGGRRLRPPPVGGTTRRAWGAAE